MRQYNPHIVHMTTVESVGVVSGVEIMLRYCGIQPLNMNICDPYIGINLRNTRPIKMHWWTAVCNFAPSVVLKYANSGSSGDAVGRCTRLSANK